MSGGHAHAPSAEGGSSSIQLANNLVTAGKDTLKIGKNALTNSGKVARSVWQNVIGRVGDVIIKKPVSAVLHLGGGPIARLVDGVSSGVTRVLTLGKVKKVQPLAKTFEKVDSLVASVVDSVANIKPQWTSREWNGTRGYLERVKKKLANCKKTTEDARKAKKEAKKASKAAHKAEESSHGEDHGHDKHPTEAPEKHVEKHAPKEHLPVAHGIEEHGAHAKEPKKEGTHGHGEHKDDHAAHATEVKKDDHSDQTHGESHEHTTTHAEHKDEPHGDIAHPAAEDDHGHAAPAH